MCALKCFGGLGFKDLKVFNVSLLGKQAWRLIREPTSLFGRVMKAKYDPSYDFLVPPLVIQTVTLGRVFGVRKL